MSTPYTTADAAKGLGVTQQTIRRWVHAGTIRPSAVLPSGQSRWSQADLDALVDSMRGAA